MRKVKVYCDKCNEMFHEFEELAFMDKQYLGTRDKDLCMKCRDELDKWFDT